MRRNTPQMLVAVVAGLLAGTGCAVGPKYVKPPVVDLAMYKELATASATDAWRLAHPSDDTIRGEWWTVFGDARLNTLEAQVSVSNQNVAAATASYLSARALVRQARTQLFPEVTTSPSVAAARTPVPIAGDVLPLDASWQADLWGTLRHTVQASVSGAQASAADLENVRLTIQAEVAADYYHLRAQDALMQLVDETVATYRDSLRVAQVQFQAGLASDETVAQAETQLQTTEAQATNLAILRAQYEHAIALLVGQPATSFTLPGAVVPLVPPPIPVGVPSQLVERRPDGGGGRTANGAGERPDRHRDRGVLSGRHAEGLGRLRGRVDRELADLVRPVLVGGSGAGRNALRRGVTASDRAAVPGRLRGDGRQLPRLGADGVSAGRGQSVGTPHPVSRNSSNRTARSPRPRGTWSLPRHATRPASIRT